MQSFTRVIHAVLAVSLGVGLSGCSKQINQLRARDQLNKGVRAFEAADFKAAASHFEAALEFDPALLTARSYEASAYMMQYVPGSASPENVKVADDALAGFREVLELDPKNELAMLSIASLYYNMEKADEAKEWNLKVIEAYPNKKEPYYTIGVIDWGRSYEKRMQARADIGMRQEDPGPIKDNKVRQQLAEELGPLHEEALKMFNKALEIDPEYEDAMNYVNLVYREMADVASTSEQYEQLWATAEEWVQKTLDTRKRLAEASAQDRFTTE
jgi:tetratricopeptide (TPR) repeat protein